MTETPPEMRHADPAAVGRAALRLARGGSAALKRRINAHLAARDDAADRLEAALEVLAENLGSRIEDALDGVPTGGTAFEASLDGITDAEAVRIAALSAQLDDLVELVRDAGLDDARAALLRDYAGLQDLAERAMADSGVEHADALLDDEAVKAAVGALAERHDEALFGAHARLSAQRIVDALHTQVGLESTAEVARRISEAEAASIPSAMTEARTRIAEADRYFSEAAVQATEEQINERFLRVYVGPDDVITRPFCDALVGRGFDIDEVRGLSNGQTAAHPIVSCGGYNCRHSWVSLRESELDDLGYTRGTASDVVAANAGGRRKRKKKAKR